MLQLITPGMNSSIPLYCGDSRALKCTFVPINRIYCKRSLGLKNALEVFKLSNVVNYS